MIPFVIELRSELKLDCGIYYEPYETFISDSVPRVGEKLIIRGARYEAVFEVIDVEYLIEDRKRRHLKQTTTVIVLGREDHERSRFLKPGDFE